ncbi:amidohydrolase family protein [Mesorhizobium sp. B4-1-4]|uniref:amidohydrolase family protein n=1 Tax=Mesorhizobium sp. B4-1-4 TaxID=2589888 RepID=UPI001127B34E|nr:amidohydrolase family protein [Mesorhizobium sp. B4-1-4]UCI32087.1 amidohydrolase family protein [Mesorhizobium sp. B4-1-4]
MANELAEFIASSPLCSTHEHTEFEKFYQESRPDILKHLFDNYVLHDLLSAGASRQALSALIDVGNLDIEARFNAVGPAWRRVELGGYGEAVKLTATKLFDIEEITATSLRNAADKTTLQGNPGERLMLLRDVANLDHVQIDSGSRPLPDEMIGQDFFHYDINTFDLCNGTPDLSGLAVVLGEDITSLASYRFAIETLFQSSAKYAVAVKSQHAYRRPLKWAERTDQEAEAALASWLRIGTDIDEEDRMCLGDWSMSHVARLAAQYDLPFKIHTGYYAENNFMVTPDIAAGNLCQFIRSHLNTRFVLMHIAYPYSDELIAMVKHYSNVAVDMCWAWSINPFHASDFLRRFLHGAPTNKIFIFGGDANVPAATVGYALQARRWLARCLQEEIDDGLLSERTGIELARFFMLDSPRSYFNIVEKNASIRSSTRDFIYAEPRPAFGEPPKSIRNSGKA